MVDKIKNMNIKKIIKVSAIIIGFALIVFSAFFSATFDFLNFNFPEWLANSCMLVGIMIFGLLMGNSTGTDIQKEKDNGRFQNACNEYTLMKASIDKIVWAFSQFWLWFKAKELKEKRIEYLIDNQFDSRVATIIINIIEKEDLIVGKLGYDESQPHEKIYVKGKAKLKKLTSEELEHVKHTFDIRLDTFGESYYLSLFDDGIQGVKKSEKGKKIAKKIAKDKRNSYIIKISSSLVISIVWAALTIKEFADGDNAAKKAWLNLLSRTTALVTSFVSGYSTSVINVRDQASAIENKTDILNEFKQSFENKAFVPETYEQMIERELQEQENKEKELDTLLNNSVELSCDNG